MERGVREEWRGVEREGLKRQRGLGDGGGEGDKTEREWRDRDREREREGDGWIERVRGGRGIERQ